jgi:hypothetical protein
MLEITRAEHLEEFRIRVLFSNGEEGVVDLFDALWGPIFESLKDPSRFKEFKVPEVLHTIAWENGADFAPEFLYERMVEQAAAHGRADARR